jgi:hypothetical protein
MPTELSKYAENQFDSATRGRLPLMGEVLADTLPRIIAAAATHAALVPARDSIISLEAAWDGGGTVLANAEAAQISATAAFEDKMASLTRKPDLDTNSPIETWDSTIRTQVAYNGTTYLYLLPNGRETITDGSYAERLDAIQSLGVRLGEQSSKPVLVTLGTTVTAFYTAANGLRLAQGTQKTAVDSAREDMEALRILCAQALYAMTGDGMRVFKAEPALVDTLFDVNLLRGPAQEIPAPPADTVWTPHLRRLSTSALPEGATRLEAWREGPGGTPELLAVGGRDALEVVVPANITFDAGDLYQLWLQSRNSRGSSGAGPKQSWTAT